MRICVCGVLVLALLSSGQAVHAEEAELHSAIAVTLESCGDMKAEEVQEALALEYQGGLLGTMVTVVCGENSATLSVVGPSNPKGRIVLVDLTGVSEIAMPRTIALLASELWTAPEADTTIQIAPAPIVPGSVAKLVGSVEPPKAPRTLQESYRTGGNFGFALGLGASAIDRSSSRFANQKEFQSWTLSVEWAARPGFGLYGSFSHANSNPESNTFSGNGGIGIIDRGEMGTYIPVVSGKYRIDIRLGAGYDKQYQPNILKLDYEYIEAGADIMYFLSDDVMATGGWTSLAILDGPRNSGYKAQIGAIWRVRPFLIEGKVTLSQADVHFRGEDFEKIIVRTELGLRYSY